MAKHDHKLKHLNRLEITLKDPKITEHNAFAKSISRLFI